MMSFVPAKPSNGFTVIELSIVLVVIGIIIGTVLVAVEMIDASNTRKQLSQLQNIQVAYKTFQLKFGATPGDTCSDADAIGLSCGDTSGTRDTQSIEDATGVSALHIPVYEPIYFFGHLIDATFLEKSLSCEMVGESPTTGYFALSQNPSAGMVAFSHESAIWLFLGINSGGIGADNCNFTDMATVSTGGVLIPWQARALDRKIDDDIPSNGIIRASVLNGSSDLDGTLDTAVGECVVDATAQEYNLQNMDPDCRIIYKLQ